MWSFTAFSTAQAIHKVPTIMATHNLYAAALEAEKDTPSNRLKHSTRSYLNQLLYIFNNFFHSEDSYYIAFVL